MRKQLTKAGFWEPLKEECPRGMKLFVEFIDKYKAENDWDTLFGPFIYGEAPKYHDLPTAMQFGIFTEFVEGTGFSLTMLGDICNDTNIRMFFKTFENFLNIKPKKKIRQ